uniref:Uncharacterized protein n=1 Tax=Anopheles epiroticus TaxID=199890 RepID=A0A182PVI6_9DIPT
MAEEQDLLELINRAISCEHPHIHGAVNLSHLRKILCLLVSSVRRPCEPSNVHHWNDSLEKDNGSERQLTDEPVRWKSSEHVPIERQHEYDEKSITLKTGSSMDHTVEQGESEAGKSGSSTSSRSSSPGYEKQSNGEAWQNVLLEIEKIAQKMTEIDERISKIEIKTQPETKCSCAFGCGGTMTDKTISPSQGNAYHIGTSNPQAAQINAAVEMFDVEPSETLNNIDGSVTLPGEAAPSEGIDGKEPSIHRTASVEAVVFREDFKNNNPTPSSSGGFVDQDRAGSDCQRLGEGKLTQPASTDMETDKATEGNVFCANFENLAAIVEGLLEREKTFSNRLANMENLVTTYTDRPRYLPEEENRILPLSMECEVQSFPQDTLHESPETVAGTNNLESTMVTNIQTKVNALENELWSLKAILKNLNIAAGGKVGVEVKTHVQCISCNCGAAMEVFDTAIPQPKPFHVKRDSKPFLRNQWDLLRKELKYSVVAPVNVQAYQQLLKKPNSFRGK